MTPEEMDHRFAAACRNAQAFGSTVEEQIAQDIMDEACLPKYLYDNGAVSALQATIVSALQVQRKAQNGNS